MPAYYSLLVPAGLAAFAAVVGIIALLWERHKAKRTARPAAERKVALG
jgi:hypothetical protein